MFLTSFRFRPFLEANKAQLVSDPTLQLRMVEIALLETEDCNGRTVFYEETGVIRDVLQNHLTEVPPSFCLSLMLLSISLVGLLGNCSCIFSF